MLENPAKNLLDGKSLSGLKPNIKLKNPLTKITPTQISLQTGEITGLPEYLNEAIPPNYLLDSINEEGIKTISVANFRNGRIPLSNMVKNENLAKDLSGDAAYLLAGASIKLNELLKLYNEAKFDGKQPLFFIDGYRNIERQKALRKSTPQAAKPGTSNHGWGLGVDINWGVPPSMNKNRSFLASAFRHPVYKWFFENGPKYGWINPSVLRNFKSINEWWHWEYRPGSPDNPPLISNFVGEFTKADLENILSSGGTFEGSEYLTNPKPPRTLPQNGSTPSVEITPKTSISGKFKNLNQSPVLPKIRTKPPFSRS